MADRNPSALEYGNSKTELDASEKGTFNHVEGVEHVHDAATTGHQAVDRYGRCRLVAVRSPAGQVLVEFDPAAEKRLVRKIDMYTVPTVAILYLFCFIDRANIGNAKLAGFSADLKLKGLEYNILLTVFYISYIIFEIPSNIW